MSDELVRPEVQALIQSMVDLSLQAQEARKYLLIEQLDNMLPHLLELEKASRNARTAIASILQREKQLEKRREEYKASLRQPQ